MSGVHSPTSAKVPAASEDPFIPLYKEHTELQMLAERFHEMAGQLERKESVAPADLLEGVEVHHRFLVRVHHAREEALAQAARASAPPEVQRAMDACPAAHAEAARFEAAVRTLVAEGPLSVDRARRLATALHREAERLLSHHKEEEESIYRRLHYILPPDIRRRFADAVRALDGEAAAAQSRLTAWASKLNASAD